MGSRIDSRLVFDALEMALAGRKPGEDLVAHSDRRSQYASEPYQGLLARHGITGRMSRRANCGDNAPAESFFASLKKELVHSESYVTRAEARASLFEYIEVFSTGSGVIHRWDTRPQSSTNEPDKPLTPAPATRGEVQ